MSKFQDEVRSRIDAAKENSRLLNDARAFSRSSIAAFYSYNFHWLGRPIIQYPQDIVAMQQIVWETQPNLIIETGIAHGGSLILSASLLALLDYSDCARSGALLDPANPRRRVLGVDIDIRAHNREAIEAHPLAPRISMIEGSSVDLGVVAKIHEFARDYDRIMLCLDSNHTHEHVLNELRALGPLVSAGCYCIVYDTIIEALPADQFPDRPWSPGNSPMTAVAAYLGERDDFEVDLDMDARIQISAAPGGYLRRRLDFRVPER